MKIFVSIDFGIICFDYFVKIKEIGGKFCVDIINRNIMKVDVKNGVKKFVVKELDIILDDFDEFEDDEKLFENFVK